MCPRTGLIKAKVHPELWAKWEPESKTIWLYDTLRSPGVQEAVEALSRLKQGDTVTVRINSYGGDAFAGFSLHSALRESPATVKVRIDGVAASAAAIVALAGDSISITEHGMVYVHRAWSSVVGNASALRSAAKDLELVDEQIAAVIERRTGAERNQVMAWLDGDDDGTAFNAEEALSVKLVDEVLKPSEKEQAEDQIAAVEAFVPDDPPGGSGEGVEGEWSRPRLQDFTDRSWQELSDQERRRIARYFGFARSLDTFGDLALPHHFPPNHRNAGKASLVGTRNALARLPLTEGLTAEDRERVRAHLRKHLPTQNAWTLVCQGLTRFAQGGARCPVAMHRRN